MLQGRLRVAIMLALALLLAAGSIAGAQYRAEITVTHWGVLLYGVPYAIAMELGFFAEHGIDLQGIVTSDGGGTTVRNVLAGRLPFGEVSTVAAVTAYNAGAPLVIVGGGARSVAEILWVARPGDPMSTIHDFRGKTIAYTSPGSVTQGVLALSMARAGMRWSDVSATALGGLGAGLTALAQRGVDAAPIMDPVWTSQQDQWKPVFWAKDYVPRYMQTVLVVSPQLLEGQPEIAKAFIDARRKGVEYLYANPEHAAEIFAKVYDLPMDVARRAIQNVIGDRWWSTGGLDAEGLKAVEEAMQHMGLISGPVAWSEMIDQRLLPEEERIELP